MPRFNRNGPDAVRLAETPFADAERDIALAAAAAAATAEARGPVARPRGRAGEPFAASDRSGMPIDLATAETNALRRHSPRRNRWPELREIDDRVADLELRQGTAAQQLRALREQHANAPTVDADRLATWELDGRKGSRPQSSRPALETEIGEVELEVAGLEAAAGRELEAKAAFVEKHRARLVKDADRATAEAHERVIELVDELEAARTALVELRSSALWAAIYPDEPAARGPREVLLAGGLAKPIKSVLGIDVALETSRVLQALRADADYWRSAATPEQRAAMLGVSDTDRAGGATWSTTPAGIAAERADKEAARRREEQMWGRGDA